MSTTAKKYRKMVHSIKIHQEIRMLILANLFVEAAMVGLVCLVFLILFVVAGIRQAMKDQD
jgi:hypothetical protein